ncbi:MAG: hypothetical protein C7N36_12635, partial [Bacteroidetes bacterium]
MNRGNSQSKKPQNANAMKFVTTIKTTLVSSLWLMIFSALVLLPNLKAEGIRQVAPTAGDAPVMLETGRPEFGSFA